MYDELGSRFSSYRIFRLSQLLVSIILDLCCCVHIVALVSSTLIDSNDVSANPYYGSKLFLDFGNSHDAFDQDLPLRESLVRDGYITPDYLRALMQAVQDK